ncbi:MAG TPA: SDR family oxidoreductase [Solirubrobacterales bacterium]
MELRGRHVVVTGGAGGIGAALGRRAAAAGAAGVVLADIDGEAASAVAADIEAGGAAAIGVGADVGTDAGIAALVSEAERRFGPIEIFCSNAGIPGPFGGPEVGDAEWQRIWEVNVMAHIRAARHLLPGMLERGSGHINSTASAAGLLANHGLMPYSVTKHAAVAVAEWLQITYGGSGVEFSCFCPLGVATPMLEAWHREDPSSKLTSGEAISPERAAETLLEGIEAGRFLILTPPEVLTYMQRRAADPERWLAGMQRLQSRIEEARAEGI